MKNAGMSETVRIEKPGGYELVTLPTLADEVGRLVGAAARWRLPLEDEKRTQAELGDRLNGWKGVEYQREAPMDQGGRGVVDFFEPRIGLAVEVKLRGGVGDITRQLRGYALDQRVRGLVLLTARPMAAPPPLGPRNVAVTVIDITGGWL